MKYPMLDAHLTAGRAVRWIFFALDTYYSNGTFSISCEPTKKKRYKPISFSSLASRKWMCNCRLLTFVVFFKNKIRTSHKCNFKHLWLCCYSFIYTDALIICRLCTREVRVFCNAFASTVVHYLKHQFNYNLSRTGQTWHVNNGASSSSPKMMAWM